MAGVTAAPWVGLAALVVGLLVTFPYASFIGAYLIGRYAQMTEPPVRAAPFESVYHPA